MWTTDVSIANLPDVDGFFKLRPAVDPSLSLQPGSQAVSTFGAIPVLSSGGDFGCRFISTSNAFNFTWRSKMLLTFLQSHMPVFVHDKGAPLPVDVGSYLSHSLIMDKTLPALPPRSYPPLPTSGNGGWLLQTSIPVSDGKSCALLMLSFAKLRNLSTSIIPILSSGFSIHPLHPRTQVQDGRALQCVSTTTQS